MKGKKFGNGGTGSWKWRDRKLEGQEFGIKLKSHCMTRVLYNRPIDTVRGAIDSVKDGQANRYRVVSRWHDYGETSYAPDGRKLHELYRYPMHEGAWSEGATKNRAMIKAAQRTAHDIEHAALHPEDCPKEKAEEGAWWVAQYEAYRHSPAYADKPYRFYNYVYVSIYRAIRAQEEDKNANKFARVRKKA